MNRFYDYNKFLVKLLDLENFEYLNIPNRIINLNKKIDFITSSK